MNASAKFWNKIAEGYSRQPIADETAYQKKLQVTREYFQPSMNVLEFGCGTGSTAIAHAPYVQHIRAIDFSANMIAIAQAKADAQNIKDLEKRLTDAGFAIDYQWQAGDYKSPIGKAEIVFIVAKKAA
jgi:ubiquinone/menaquinone biosynthesis C-methylase UbiE